MTRRVHVVGAGVAGLAAAAHLAGRPGLSVTVWEATRRAGGRCWSFHDDRLDRRIDNGNHLILSGNRALLAHARRIGGDAFLETLPEAAFPFVESGTGRRWTVRVPSGPLDALRRGVGLPGLGPGLLADVLRLLAAGPERTVAQAVRGRGEAWRDFWTPMCLAVLNAPPDAASARLLAAVLRETFLRGPGACRPVLAPRGLGAALIDPALDLLRRQGGEFRTGRRLTAIPRVGDRAAALRFGQEELALNPEDRVILAAPPGPLAQDLGVAPGPGGGLSILNAHFRLDPDVAAGAPAIAGIGSGAAHWVFRRGDVLSATVSAAEESDLAGLGAEAILDRLWPDVALAAGRPEAAWLARRLVRERGATPEQSPAAAARRPGWRTRLANVVLAGDQVAGPLPATLEAAARSGLFAAEAILRR